MNSHAADVSSLAATTARLAVLLESGVPPGAAWAYVGESAAPESGGAQRVVAALQQGGPVPDAVCAAAVDGTETERAAWRGLAAAWAVATDAGASLAPTLRQFSETLRDLVQVQREVTVALAAPTLTARLVLVLPLVGILFGLLLGFDTIRVLVATAAGWACLGVASALLFGASRWNARLVRRAQPKDLAPGLVFDLVAIAVSGGASLERALGSVTETARRYEVPAALDDLALLAVLDLSRRAGVPAAALLRGEALERRREASATAQAGARSLGIALMVPLGVCVLPAFMVLSVVPLLLAVLHQTTVPT